MPYPIGSPGRPWNAAERRAWRDRQSVRRSYNNDVVTRIEALRDRFDITIYGTVQTHPLFGMRSRTHHPDRPTVFITGGVHGYETSGVHGAIRFAETHTDRVNLVIAPCVSPWAYEAIQRWNPDAIDPNRSFVPDSPAPECSCLMDWVSTLPRIDVHIDLHETTDSDNSEFRPAKAARDGIEQSVWNIPDGFYLVGRTDRPVPAFQAAVRDAVAKVTHIAPADADGRLIGVPLSQPGVVNYDAVALGLCMGMTDATYTTTTEVYPDSPRASAVLCNEAQVAAITGAIDYVLAYSGTTPP